jgi:hypothetical protein
MLPLQVAFLTQVKTEEARAVHNLGNFSSCQTHASLDYVYL